MAESVEPGFYEGVKALNVRSRCTAPFSPSTYLSLPGFVVRFCFPAASEH